MRKYKWIIILVNLVIVLFLFNRSVIEKETLLENGKLVLLKLAPVDPRSLMQGDYMRLRYEISQGIPSDSITNRGYCIVKLDSQGIANRIRLQKRITPLTKGEYPILYTKRGQRIINIGAESYFFEEGQAEKFEEAAYGGLMIDENGNNVLIGLYNENLELIQ